MFLCHISHPTSRCKHTTSKSSPSWRSAHRKAEALSSGWSRHSFLRPGGSYFFQRCPEFCVQRVKNVTSQAIVAMVIFANAIWLAIQTDWRLRLGQEGAVVLACLVLLKWTCDKYSHSRSSSWSCQILLGNFSLQSTWRDDWDGRCVTVSPGTRMLHSKVEWRKPRLKKLMWPLPFGLSEISRWIGSVFYPFCDLIDSDTEKCMIFVEGPRFA